MKKTAMALGATALLLACAGAAAAHHSAAMFDASKEVSLSGTVKEFQYTNPHSWLVVNIPDAAGKVTEWSFEAEGPSTLLRAGIKKSSLMPGDKVTVKGHPLKDGRPGAGLMNVTKADGTVLTPRPAPPPGGAPAAPRPAG
ncbi:MAG TPA: DUF6152 family protein [Caulobacteraceae bacterium]|jgi:hypothetical protein|nr:DUF6152 family protein [Caulobacteraceae bacterium]